MAPETTDLEVAAVVLAASAVAETTGASEAREHNSSGGNPISGHIDASALRYRMESRKTAIEISPTPIGERLPNRG